MAEIRTPRDKLMHSDGTTALDTLSAIVPTVFYTVITGTIVQLLHIRSTKLQFLVEFVLLVVPIVLNVTLLADYCREILIATFIISVSLLVTVDGGNPPKKPQLPDNITNTRSTTGIISIIAILAVDFMVFPRRFAKTESFGHSLMDVGVGLYVFSNGMVEGGRSDLFKSIKGCIPLLVLGMVRFLVVRQLDYQVPVSEYGIHWNFFLTLAVSRLFVTLLFHAVDIRFVWINAGLLMVSHEVLLETAFKNFVMSDVRRTTFLTANREGLVSCMGYVCIYLFSAYFSYVLDLKKGSNYRKMIPKLVCLCLLTLFVSVTCEKLFGISRKLANTAYCFWVLFIGIFMTGLFSICGIIIRRIFGDKLRPNIYPSLIFLAINYNGLAFFLLANLLTGLVNLMCDTLVVGTASSLLIIISYTFTACVVVCILYQRQIKLKL